ncbi:MAG: hypothetical protein ACM3VT_08500, partial [Solirubrobacterales bacterium]
RSCMGMKRRVVLAAVALVAVVAVGVGLFFFVGQPRKLYRVTVLPSLGGDQMGAHAINDRGQVVGKAQTPDGQRHFFFWDPQGGMQDLGVTGEGRFDINNTCQIAGSMIDPNGNEQAFLWECDKGRTLLGTLGGKTSQVMAINNRGQIVGTSETADGSSHAFLWDPARGMRDLGTLGGTDSQGHAINDAGVVFGYSDAPTREDQPFIWDANDGMVAIGPSCEITRLNGINSGFWVVGGMFSPDRGGVWMAAWRKGAGPTELFPIDMPLFEPALLNDANQIVFWDLGDKRPWWLPKAFFHRRYREYLWDPNRGIIRLDPYISAGRKESFYPMDINNKGCIVGFLYREPKPPHPACARAIVLEPISERWDK